MFWSDKTFDRTSRGKWSFDTENLSARRSEHFVVDTSKKFIPHLSLSLSLLSLSLLSIQKFSQQSYSKRGNFSPFLLKAYLSALCTVPNLSHFFALSLSLFVYFLYFSAHASFCGRSKTSHTHTFNTVYVYSKFFLRLSMCQCFLQNFFQSIAYAYHGQKHSIPFFLKHILSLIVCLLFVTVATIRL